MDELLSNPQALAAGIGILLSLVFGFFPKLKAAYAAKSDEFKSSLMTGLVLLTGVGIGVWKGLDVEGFIMTILFAGTGNQVTFGLMKRLMKGGKGE